MGKINIILSGLLFITDRSGGSPSVGAAVGITNLFRPSAEVPLVSHSYPSYLDYPYQYSGNYDNSLELNTHFGNLLVDDKNDAEASYDDFISDVYSYSQDRQVGVGEPFVLDSVSSTENIGLPNLTPLLFSTALIVGLSAVFAGVVNVNSTASNATVPSGLWAIPSLGDLPLIGNGSFPTGRKRRSVMDNIVEESGDYFEMAEDLGKILGPSLSDHQSGENIRDNVRSALTSVLLMDSSDECQAAFGCRLGHNVKENRGSISSSSIYSLLRLISPLQWNTFTEVFRTTMGSDTRDRGECERFKCQLCLSL